MSNVISINRPGVVLGDYPERVITDECKWDKSITRIFNRKRSSSANEKNEFLTQVELKQHDLSQLSFQRMHLHVKELSAELYSMGMTDELIIKAFALVKEISMRTLGIQHYDCQLLAGLAITQGKLAEMQTGEGKTLAATLPACTAALAGIPVHIITSNDYLVARDAELMLPIYKTLGLSVGVITEESNEEQRRASYQCNITYCTGKQVVFDYLRDRIIRENNSSNLKHKIDKLLGDKSTLSKLVMRGLSFAIVDEADSILIDEARTPFILSESIKNEEEIQTYKEALSISEKLEDEYDYIVKYESKEISLTDNGLNKIESLCESLSSIWKSSLRRKELIRQALYAKYILLRDRDYLIDEKAIKIIDQNTGRIMPDRSWGLGLQQMVELKEGCELSRENKTLSRITYQEFFKKYISLAGMTGTANEVRRELQDVYSLDVAIIPPNKNNVRAELPLKIFKSLSEKWHAVVKEIIEINKIGRPILVGTRSVEDSELLSELLSKSNLSHQVLNARQNKKEADIVAKAGNLNAITIATNMAGRGTDIKLTQQVEEIGGLHVIVTQKNDSSRIDRQLYGRCARQGDKGSYRFILSMQDQLIEYNYSNFQKNIFKHFSNNFSKKVGNKLAEIAQHKVEIEHEKHRKRIMRIEPEIKNTLAFAASVH